MWGPFEAFVEGSFKGALGAWSWYLGPYSMAVSIHRRFLFVGVFLIRALYFGSIEAPDF